MALPACLCYKHLTREREMTPHSEKNDCHECWVPHETTPRSASINVLQLPLGNGHPALLGHPGFLMFTEEKQIGLSARNMEPNPGFPALTLPTHKAEILQLLSKTQFPYSYAGIRFVLTTTKAMSKTNHPRHGLVLTKINSPMERSFRLVFG